MAVAIESKQWYPYPIRAALRLHEAGMLPNVVSITTEPTYGYLAQLRYKDGSCRIIHEHDLGVNQSAAARLATDKRYTKFMLRTLDLHCPRGAEFLLPWWAKATQSGSEPSVLQTTNDIADYVNQNLHYPIYIKPANGSEGQGVFRVDSADELAPIIKGYNKDRVELAVVEAPVVIPDYRLVVFDGQLICAYRRTPLSVVGDGKSSVRRLIRVLQKQYDAAGRSVRLASNLSSIRRYLAKRGVTLDDILAPDQIMPLLAVSNLSTGGTAEDVTSRVDARWIELAVTVARNFNLRLLGLDLACQDITSPGSDYSIIEVNAYPGLGHYACSGDAQRELVDQFYAGVLGELPATLRAA